MFFTDDVDCKTFEIASKTQQQIVLYHACKVTN